MAPSRTARHATVATTECIHGIPCRGPHGNRVALRCSADHSASLIKALRALLPNQPYLLMSADALYDNIL